jgi:tripartite-type tricarboxylate transporter receptor subunit TctC
MIGTDAVAKAPADGYTLGLVGVSNLILNPLLYPKNPYNAINDFTGLTTVGVTHQVLAVHPSVPAKNLKELVALAKKEPGKLTCGSSGTGGLIHLTCEMFKVAAGIDVLHIPYKGTALLMPDLISGRVTMALDTLPPYLPMLKEGKVRALAITTAKRSALMPDLPTVAESGYPGFESIASYGFFAPTGTSPAIIERLNREINAVLIEPELKAKLTQQAIDIQGSTTQALADFVDGEIAKWATVIKASNIQRE